MNDPLPAVTIRRLVRIPIVFPPFSMTKPSFRRLGAFMAVSFLTLTVLTACSASANDQAAAEAYIRANVSDLSPTPAVLGGTFQVTDIEWEDEDTAIVSYEDGHIALKGRTDIRKNGDAVTVTEFVIVDDHGYGAGSGSALSTSSVAGTGSTATGGEDAPRAKEGETCGGIAGIQCDFGLMCQYEGAYPDASGTCVK